jgi:hypothetical protein
MNLPEVGWKSSWGKFVNLGLHVDVPQANAVPSPPPRPYSV